MRKMKRIMATLACAMLVVVMAVPISAEAGVIQRAPGTMRCNIEVQPSSGIICGETAKFQEQYAEIVGYGNVTNSTHEEYVLAVYKCPKGHKPKQTVSIGAQNHILTIYDDLGHTGSGSNTHQYWRRCKCGYGENIYVDCNFEKTGVHTKP